LRIAILEDDPDQLALLSRWMTNAGHNVRGYLLGYGILRDAFSEKFDLFVLDWELPDVSGLDVMRRIRGKLSTSVPILFVTVRDTEDDIVLALDAGADDYIVKPARQNETLARVGALLRRAYPHEKKRFLIVPPYEFDIELATVRVNGVAASLTPKEFELATLFFQNIDQLMSRIHLQEALWGRGAEIESRTVDTHISNVRKKLGLRGEHGFRISAIYHYGYRLKAIPDQVAKVFSGN
jgi:two-component system response regulator RegX3